MAKPDFGCGRPECHCSSNICEQLTFGVGFDFMTGCFEEPCEICARAWERIHPEDAPCWPPSGSEEEKFEAENPEGS